MSVKFPNVPLAPGVPPVFRTLAQQLSDGVAGIVRSVENKLVADSIARQGTSPAVWAIYGPDGNPALEPDNWLHFEPMAEANVADYPMQPDSFQSYNKVQTPQEVRVTVTIGGSDSDRQDFLNDCDALRLSTDLVDIIVPDFSFIGYSLTHVDYSRASDRGITLIAVDLNFKEIRQSATAAFSNSKEPSGSDTVNDGPVRPVPFSDQLAGAPE